MATSGDIDRMILTLASASESVVHARELRAGRVRRASVMRRVATGFMTPRLPRTYVVGPDGAAPNLRTRCVVGTKAGGPGSFVDGTTAAFLLGAWDDRFDDVVHVTTPGRSLGTRHPGFVFHRAEPSWSPTEPVAVGAVDVVGFIDACVRAAMTLTKWQLAFVVQRGIYLRLVTLAELEAAVSHRSRHPGNETLRVAVALVRSGSVGTRGRTEDAVLADVSALGFEVPLVNVRGALGLSRDEPDLVWPGRRANVEIDGGQHDEPAQQADDERRDAEARSLGWRVPRVRARDYWRRRRSVVRRIAAFLED